MKMYFYTALFAMLLYPFGWYFLVGPVTMIGIYSTTYLVIYISAGVALASTGSLYFMRKSSQDVDHSYRFLLVWFFGPMISGLLCALELYAVIVMQSGRLVPLDFDWVLAVQMPGTLTAFVAFAFASLFTTPVHELAVKIPIRRM